MAIINIQRFRDTLVRSGVAEEAPALEVAVALDEELESVAEGLATKQDLQQLAAEIRQIFAEQEARHQQQLNRLAILMLSGAALIAAVAGVLVAVLG